MQAPSSSDGIQRLLAAEQEAQAIIAKARKGDAIRVARASLLFVTPGPHAAPHSQERASEAGKGRG